MAKKSTPAPTPDEQPAAPLADYVAEPDPAANTPEVLQALAVSKAREQAAALVRATYSEEDIATCVRYGFRVEDVPTLVDTRDTFWAWLRQGTEGYLLLGENLSAIKEGMPHGKWSHYLEWIGLEQQAASRMIGAWQATQSWPQLAEPAMVERIDQSAYGKVIGQGRERITPEVVDALVGRAAGTGKVSEADAKAILEAHGHPLPPRRTRQQDPDLGFTRMDPTAAALNADTAIAAFAVWIMEAQQDGVQPGLVRLTPGYKAFVKEATDPTQPAKTVFTEMIRQWLAVAYRWSVSAGDGLALYTPDPVEAGVYRTEPGPEWSGANIGTDSLYNSDDVVEGEYVSADGPGYGERRMYPTDDYGNIIGGDANELPAYPPEKL